MRSAKTLEPEGTMDCGFQPNTIRLVFADFEAGRHFTL